MVHSLFYSNARLLYSTNKIFQNTRQEYKLFLTGTFMSKAILFVLVKGTLAGHLGTNFIKFIILTTKAQFILVDLTPYCFTRQRNIYRPHGQNELKLLSLTPYYFTLSNTRSFHSVHQIILLCLTPNYFTLSNTRLFYSV